MTKTIQISMFKYQIPDVRRFSVTHFHDNVPL